MNMEGYLANHDNRPIGNGRSGAEIWEIEEKYVLKHIRKENLPDAGAFPLYCNEAYFYRFWGQQAGGAPSFLPKVLEVQVTDDEIFILMKRYQELSRAEADDRLLRKVMGTLAMIHTQDIPAFLRQEQRPPEYLAREQIESCLAGWRSVLAEHPGAFDERILADTAADINELIGWHHEEPQVLTHGDFHWENLLRRENGDIVVCDWQGVGAGDASGDISFFVSRLGADGTGIEPRKAAEIYCQERLALTGERIESGDLVKHMEAANVIVSFRFWHEYLHGSSRERVGGIYEKMRTE